MAEVDEALAAIENGDDGYWIIEALALEVRCNQTTIARLRNEVAELRFELGVEWTDVDQAVP